MRSTARTIAPDETRLPLLLAGLLMAWLALAASSGCAVNPATGRTSLTGTTTTAEEIRIGREQRPQVIQAFGGIYDDPALAAYVERVGQSLARGTERPDITYSFTILDTPIVNALATPGGYISTSRADCSRWPTTKPSWQGCLDMSLGTLRLFIMRSGKAARRSLRSECSGPRSRARSSARRPR